MNIYVVNVLLDFLRHRELHLKLVCKCGVISVADHFLLGNYLFHLEYGNNCTKPLIKKFVSWSLLITFKKWNKYNFFF